MNNLVKFTHKLYILTTLSIFLNMCEINQLSLYMGRRGYKNKDK